MKMDEKSKIGVGEMGLAMQRFGWPDYVIFVLMLSMCGFIGIYFGFIKKQSTVQDYLMGGRNMKLFPVTMSLVASFISGITLLGTPTEVYVYGAQYAYIAAGAALSALYLSTIYLPVLHSLGLTSVYEYLQIRFDRRVRLFGSLLFTLGTIAWLPIVIYVPALAFNQVTGINVHIITPIVCLVCIFYTSVGGLKAVVWTDVVQTLIMFGAMILIVVKGTYDVGGISVLWERNWQSGRIEAPNVELDPYSRHTIWSLVVGGSVYWLCANAISQSMMQRYLSLPDLATATRAVWYFFLGVLSLIALCCYSGMLIFATYHDCDPLTTKLVRKKDQLLPLLVMDVLGNVPGMPGLFVAGVFSAALSSLSTGLNSMAAVVLEDFYKPFVKKELSKRQIDILVRTVVILLGLLCVGLVFVVEKLGTVLQLSMTLSSTVNGPQLGLFTSGILLPWINSRGALIGGCSGLTFMAWLALGAQHAMARGELTFVEKPVYTHGCQYTFEPLLQAPHSNGTAKDFMPTDEVFFLYRLSYLWNTLLGCSVTVLVALAASWASGARCGARAARVDPRLLAPIVRPYFADKTVQLEMIDKIQDSEVIRSLQN